MTFGLSVQNEAGVLQIDDSNPVLEVGQTTTASFYIFNPAITYLPLVWLEVGPTIASIDGNVNSKRVYIQAYDSSGAGLSIGATNTVTAYIMKPSQRVPSGGNGMEVFNSSGSLIYTSEMPMINIQNLNLITFTTSLYTTGTGLTSQVRETVWTTPAATSRPLVLLNSLRYFHWGNGNSRYKFGLRAHFNADNSVSFKVQRRYSSNSGQSTTIVFTPAGVATLGTAIRRN